MACAPKYQWYARLGAHLYLRKHTKMNKINLNEALNRVIVDSKSLKLDDLSLMIIICAQNGIIPHIEGLHFIYGEEYINSLTIEQEAELTEKIIHLMSCLMGYGLISLESK